MNAHRMFIGISTKLSATVCYSCNTVLQTKNSIRRASVINPVTTDIMDMAEFSPGNLLLVDLWFFVADLSTG